MAQSCPLPFASKSVTEHLLRGFLGIEGMIFALQPGGTRPIVSVVLVLGSLLALRGCPLCWVAGLFGTLQQKFSRQSL
jgi:hypothetical protein